MLRRHSTVALSVIAFIIAFMFVGSAQAGWDWGLSISLGWPHGSYNVAPYVSYRGSYASSPRQYYSYSDYDYRRYDNKTSTERRKGDEADDFVERGESSITESPLFDDGIRLTARASLQGEDYEHGMASAVYYFNVPPNARSMKIKVSYDGETEDRDTEGGIAGRIWIKKVPRGEEYEKYYPKEEKYEGVDKPLFGSTFVLRAEKHSETIMISADDHEINGMIEVHVVAEGRQRIDINYVETEAYESRYVPRVVTRGYNNYASRPWYDYTYSYFYTGPYFHFGDGFYLSFNYPRYGHYYGSIRHRYSNYLNGYYARHPRRYRRPNLAARSRGSFRQIPRGRVRSLGSLRSYTSRPARTRGYTGGLSIRRRPTSSSQPVRGHTFRQAPTRSTSRGFSSAPRRSSSSTMRRRSIGSSSSSIRRRSSGSIRRSPGRSSSSGRSSGGARTSRSRRR